MSWKRFAVGLMFILMTTFLSACTMPDNMQYTDDQLHGAEIENEEFEIPECYTVSRAQYEGSVEQELFISPGDHILVCGSMSQKGMDIITSQNDNMIFHSDYMGYCDIEIPSTYRGSVTVTLRTEKPIDFDVTIQRITPLPDYDTQIFLKNFQIYSPNEEGGFDVYNHKQELLTSCYSKISSYGEELLFVQKEEGEKYCAIDAEGNEIWPAIISAVEYFPDHTGGSDFIQNKEHYEAIMIDNRVGIINAKGKLIVPFGDIDIERSCVLPDQTLMIRTGTLILPEELTTDFAYPCLDGNHAQYRYSSDGVQLSVDEP